MPRARNADLAGGRPATRWETLHVAIDDCSRLAYTEILPDECGATCAAFLGRAAHWFAAAGSASRAS